MSHLRIVVQLNERNEEENFYDEHCTEQCRTPGASKIEVHLVDYKTIQVNLSETYPTPNTMIAHKMNFDYVSYEVKNCLKTEFASMLNELFYEKQNCALIFFTAHRECNLTFLYRIFIVEVNKCLHQLQANLSFVKVDYKNIGEAVSKGSYLEVQFNSTRELLTWLFYDYRYKWSQGDTHEVLDLTFSVMCADKSVFKVKFSLFNVYLDKMDIEVRSSWQKYMERLSLNDEYEFVHSNLTASLSSHIESSTNGRTLLLFNVPTNIKDSADTLEMLQMAHVTVKYRNQALKLQRALIKRTTLPTTTTDISFGCNDSALSDGISSNAGSYSAHNNSDPNNSNNKSLCRDSQPYTKKDLNSLSGWFRKVDEKFTWARATAEQYFENCFDAKINEICNNIKIISRNKESEAMKTIENSKEIVQNFYAVYKAASEDFYKLRPMIETLSYAEVLRIYMETKTFEFSQFLLNCKIKRLEYCQQRFSSSINEELCILNFKLYIENEQHYNKDKF